MNSLIGLLSISLFYIYVLRGAGWRYSLLLASLIVPIAVLANMVRITLLVLLTYYFGDAVAQGFLHSTAGFLLFELRSEEHTSELQSLMRTSYAVFCLKKTK